MDDNRITTRPATLDAIERGTKAIGFGMASDLETESLFRALAASKRAGRVLELGTGTGMGAAWLLDGMDAASTLLSVDNDANAQRVARTVLGQDPRATFHLDDAATFISSLQMERREFDLVYADTWAGKFSHLDAALSLVAVGGFYFVDDLLPQPNWPEGHAAKLPPLIHELELHPDFASVKLAWTTGLMVLVRTRNKD